MKGSRVNTVIEQKRDSEVSRQVLADLRKMKKFSDKAEMVRSGEKTYYGPEKMILIGFIAALIVSFIGVIVGVALVVTGIMASFLFIGVSFFAASFSFVGAALFSGIRTRNEDIANGYYAYMSKSRKFLVKSGVKNETLALALIGVDTRS